MAAAAHTKGGFGGVPQSVGKEFNRADAGTGIIKPKKSSPGPSNRSREVMSRGFRHMGPAK
jgi:hypothetical protein